MGQAVCIWWKKPRFVAMGFVSFDLRWDAVGGVAVSFVSWRDRVCARAVPAWPHWGAWFCMARWIGHVLLLRVGVCRGVLQQWRWGGRTLKYPQLLVCHSCRRAKLAPALFRSESSFRPSPTAVRRNFSEALPTTRCSRNVPFHPAVIPAFRGNDVRQKWGAALNSSHLPGKSDEVQVFAMLSPICKFFPGQQWAFAGMT